MQSNNPPTKSGGADRFDVHQAVTDKIVAAIEAGAGDWQMPWHRAKGASAFPINVKTGNAYRGINTVVLWCTALDRGYETPVWGTFKQWLDRGTPVRKGEKATPGVFYKDLDITERDDATGETTEKTIGMAKAFWLFNAAQVEGYEPPAAPEHRPSLVDAIAHADAAISATGAVIQHDGGHMAYYRPSTDSIHLPEPSRFVDTAARSATEGYYATKLHELIHWTGAKSRLDRDLSGRFKSDTYAMEELVAEIGAAFLCAELAIAPEVRPDHAQYVAGWLKVLKDDKRAIFTAAAMAQKASSFLMGFSAPQPTRPDVTDPGAGPTSTPPSPSDDQSGGPS